MGPSEIGGEVKSFKFWEDLQSDTKIRFLDPEEDKHRRFEGILTEVFGEPGVGKSVYAPLCEGAAMYSYVNGVKLKWQRPKVPSKAKGRRGTRRAWKRANPPAYLPVGTNPETGFTQIGLYSLPTRVLDELMSA